MPRHYEVAAYYFPNFHPDARNAIWHGVGWTAWDLVRAATPRFPGHAQPKVPTWGVYDEADPQWAAREIDLRNILSATYSNQQELLAKVRIALMQSRWNVMRE